LVEKAKREDRFCLLFDDETHRFFMSMNFFWQGEFDDSSLFSIFNILEKED
jgi:hypothetical protein